MPKTANINVDVLIDFCPGGKLAAPGGDEIVPIINEETCKAQKKGELNVFLADCHPDETVHYERWGRHCTRGSHGQQFHPDLYVPDGSFVIYKGTGSKDDGYSGFDENNVEVYIVLLTDRMVRLEVQTLHDLLQTLEVTDIRIRGLATNFCDKATAVDGAKLGYKVKLFLNACRAIPFPPDHPDNEDRAIQEMQDSGVEII